METLLKKRTGKGRTSDGEPRVITEPSTARESPAELSPQESPRPETRETVASKKGHITPSERGRVEPTPAAGSERQRIKIRESAVRDTHADVRTAPRDKGESPRIRTQETAIRELSTNAEQVPQNVPQRPTIKIKETTIRDLRTNAVAEPRAAPELSPQIKTRESAVRDLRANAVAEPQTAPELPQIRTRGTITGAPPDSANTIPSGVKGPPDRRAVKTKDAYIQRQSIMSPDQPTQVADQDFTREQGRKLTIQRTKARRTGNGAVPQAGDDGDAAPAVLAKRDSVSDKCGDAPARRQARPGSSAIPPARESEKRIIHTAQSVRNTPERTARHTIKTVERSSKQTIKTAQRTAKTASKTVKTAAQTAKTAQKTAQAAAKASQRAAQAARTAAKATAAATKAAVQAAITAAKAAIAAAKALIAAIAAGGWVAIVIVIVIVLVGVLLASPFGIFFADPGSAPSAVSPAQAVGQINQELSDYLEMLQSAGYDSVEVTGQPPAWAEVLAVFAVRVASGNGADVSDVAVLDANRVAKLGDTFWAMTKITTETKTIDHPASGDTAAWTEKILVITITPRTSDDMRVFYSFSAEQNAQLDELLENRNLLTQLAGDLTITDADAKALLAALPEDLSTERRIVIEKALSLVGKVTYFWGGKSYVIGWDSRWGRIQKVTAADSTTTGTYRPCGLDCSGFVCRLGILQRHRRRLHHRPRRRRGLSARILHSDLMGRSAPRRPRILSRGQPCWDRRRPG